MKAPICEKCMQSDTLCPACKEKVDAGKVTACDIRVARNLYNLSKDVKELHDVEIIRAVESPDLIVIICARGDAKKIVGSNGIIVKELSKILQKAIRVVEKPYNRDDFIEKLLHPIPVLGINILYTPHGEMLKVIIPKGRKPPVSDEYMSDILKKLYDQDMVIVNE
ncbi:MAG: hypothetical protein GXO64_01515 [Candidatus Micrarchaeota archaeon]|nr:hypothetical protein [Candidatus Micrarchaeota archaeon]